MSPPPPPSLDKSMKVTPRKDLRIRRLHVARSPSSQIGDLQRLSSNISMTSSAGHFPRARSRRSMSDSTWKLDHVALAFSLFLRNDVSRVSYGCLTHLVATLCLMCPIDVSNNSTHNKASFARERRGDTNFARKDALHCAEMGRQHGQAEEQDSWQHRAVRQEEVRLRRMRDEAVLQQLQGDEGANVCAVSHPLRFLSALSVLWS